MGTQGTAELLERAVEARWWVVGLLGVPNIFGGSLLPDAMRPWLIAIAGAVLWLPVLAQTAIAFIAGYRERSAGDSSS